MLTSKFWEKYFEVYDTLNYLRPYQSLMGALRDKVDPQPGDTILDLGGGTGNLSVLLAAEAGATIHCVDMSEEGLARCSAKNPRIHIQKVDITERLPFADASIDTIVSNNVLYAIEKEKRPMIMQEMYRVLKPGGRVVLANLVAHFKPWRIYVAHLKEDFADRGLLAVISDVLKYLIPTLRIFYYNAMIKRENRSGSYDFFELGEQKDELQAAGFKPGDTLPAYAAQAELVTAQK